MRHAAFWVAAERLPELRAVHPGCDARAGDRAAAVARGARLDARGGDRRAAARPPDDRRPDDRARRSPRSLAIDEADADAALLALESEGVVLRGHFDRARDRGDPIARRVVRPAAAGAHPSLHAQSPARRDRAGQPGRLHALPVRLAARRSGEPADRRRRPAGGPRAARRLRAGGRRVGARRPAGARRPLRAVDARHAVPDRRSRLGAAVRAGGRGRRRWSARRRSRCSCASTRGMGSPEGLRSVRRVTSSAADSGTAPRVRTPATDAAVSDDGPARARRAAQRAARRSSTSWPPPAAWTTTARARGARELVAAGLVASDGFAGLRAIIRSSSGRAGRPRRRPIAASPGRWSLLRRRGRRRDRRHDSRRSSAGAGAAPALRRRLPAPARARSERRAVARAGARLSPARGARRNSRRPLRRRHVRRTVRARRRRRAAARSPPHAGGRPLPRGQRRRSAEPRRHRHRRRSRARRRGEPAASIATACRWQRWKAITCDHWPRSTRRSPRTRRARCRDPALSVVSGFVGR